MIAAVNIILPIVIYSWWFIYFLDELILEFEYRFNDKLMSVFGLDIILLSF